MKAIISQIRIGLIVFGSIICLVLLAKLIPDNVDFRFAKNEDDSGGQYRPIDWRILRGLDMKTGEISEELKAFDGQLVKIPGFIVPLEDNSNQVSEFLLVPSPQACIHVPPPPANQMIYVRMKEPFAFKWGTRAIWAHGRLSFKSTESPYGKISFELAGDYVKNFSSLDL